jgi:hypothetical protein
MELHGAALSLNSYAPFSGCSFRQFHERAEGQDPVRKMDNGSPGVLESILEASSGRCHLGRQGLLQSPTGVEVQEASSDITLRARYVRVFTYSRLAGIPLFCSEAESDTPQNLCG